MQERFQYSKAYPEAYKAMLAATLTPITISATLATNKFFMAFPRTQHRQEFSARAPFKYSQLLLTVTFRSQWDKNAGAHQSAHGGVIAERHAASE